jgi:glycosyltransferase involved in cell wall biosynthesis
LGCEGLAVEDGVHLLIRDQPEAFADRVLELLGNSEMRQQLCQNGRALVEQYYDWRQIFEAAEAKIVAEFKSWQAKYSATMPDYALPD